MTDHSFKLIGSGALIACLVLWSWSKESDKPALGQSLFSDDAKLALFLSGFITLYVLLRILSS